jgi:prevent-host-death family protein
MRSVGVRELKEHTSKIIRRVHENGETIEVTCRGKVVAQLVPAGLTLPQERPINKEELDAFWKEWDRLSEEISKDWPEGVSAQDAINDVRRDL